MYLKGLRRCAYYSRGSVDESVLDPLTHVLLGMYIRSAYSVGDVIIVGCANSSFPYKVKPPEVMAYPT